MGTLAIYTIHKNYKITKRQLEKKKKQEEPSQSSQSPQSQYSFERLFQPGSIQTTDVETGERTQEELCGLMSMYQAYHTLLWLRQEDNYALRGAVIRCQYGTKPARLDCLRDHGVIMGNLPVMTCRDCRDTNIHNFGSCMCPESRYRGRLPMTAPVHPNGQLAKKLAENEFAHICVPMIKGPWLQTGGDIEIVNKEAVAHALVKAASLTCLYGGRIQIVEVPIGTERFEEKTVKYVVIEKVINVRKGPSATKEDSVLFQCKAAERLYIFENETKTDAEGRVWRKVDLENSNYVGDEKVGWVCDDYILPDKPVITDCFPEKLKIYEITDNKRTLVEELEPHANWSIVGTGSYKGKSWYLEEDENKKDEDKRCKIAVGPKLLNPKYPDSGKISNDELLAYSGNAVIVIADGDKEIPINCYVIDLKAHSYNKYPVDGHTNKDEISVEAEVESGIVQTGIRYPYATNKTEYATNNRDGSIVEFCTDSNGYEEMIKALKLKDLKSYKLIRVEVTFKDEL